MELISTSVMMLSVTERIKQRIVGGNEVGFVEMVEFVRGKCRDRRGLF